MRSSAMVAQIVACLVAISAEAQDGSLAPQNEVNDAVRIVLGAHSQGLSEEAPLREAIEAVDDLRVAALQAGAASKRGDGVAEVALLAPAASRVAQSLQLLGAATEKAHISASDIRDIQARLSRVQQLIADLSSSASASQRSDLSAELLREIGPSGGQNVKGTEMPLMPFKRHRVVEEGPLSNDELEAKRSYFERAALPQAQAGQD